jgi:hypothetical protein
MVTPAEVASWEGGKDDGEKTVYRRKRKKIKLRGRDENREGIRMERG